MKLKTGVIIGLLVLVALAGSSFVVLSNGIHNSTQVTIETNGTEVSVESSSWLCPAPKPMLEEMKIKEIAASLKITESAVKMRLQRALINFRKILKESDLLPDGVSYL